ncbi:serine hydrolase domain-containing protein [Mucilaginibacter sp. X4EP1]|uniref:serine hydrolase domain-containing protein n=1 Tax=Mucilaginibacter sp. X4EP1 TaxID=2723092 RepID=UPI00216A2041|nr:serine hydrolase [Mucilaginibacter sp. X4EP1]MCS3815959.1 CubicO group peptidase (beta-lactamase class C family) [Mucilaginibacter sp. X4EP1]
MRKHYTSIQKSLFALWIIAAIIFFLPNAASAQKISYQQLKEYEGLYEFMNHSTLQIAASPADSTLYAIIKQSRYKLRYKEKDFFLNNANSPVVFLRDKQGVVNGYTTDKNTFKLINRNVQFPAQMWYPRAVADRQNFVYNYNKPEQVNDGLATADLTGSGLDPKLLATMMHKIVAGQYPGVHSILIIKNKKLVFEEYFYEYTRDTLQELRSASKSVVSALTGIAIHNGIIKSVHEKLPALLPQYHFANPSSLKDQITLQDILDNQSGVNYDEAWDKSIGNEVDMGFSKDWVKYTFDLPMIDTPGKIGRYNSGNPITAGLIVEKHSGMSMYDFAAKNLFGPLGVTHFEWDFKPDPSNADNFCQVKLRPRDMAKFGLLFLNNGTWDGHQIIPAEWVAESTAKHSVVEGVDYGYLWWLKYLDADGVRYHGLAAQGNGGQKIYVFRDLDLIVVTTGGNYNAQSPADVLIKTYILPAFNKSAH